MKIKEGYVLREVAGTWIVLPLSSKTISFKGMLTLNNSGIMLWNILEKGCSEENLTDALTSEYEVSEEQAKADVEEFIAKLAKAGCIEE